MHWTNQIGSYLVTTVTKKDRFYKEWFDWRIAIMRFKMAAAVWLWMMFSLDTALLMGQSSSQRGESVYILYFKHLSVYYMCVSSCIYCLLQSPSSTHIMECNQDPRTKEGSVRIINIHLYPKQNASFIQMYVAYLLNPFWEVVLASPFRYRTIHFQKYYVLILFSTCK